MPGTLYVVATPIGNLGDITARAVEVLRAVPHIAAEDTRHSRVLLEKLGIGTRAVSLPAFDEKGRVDHVLAPVVEGADLALVTDAGTPAISDPGGALVARAVLLGIRVVPIPGACAAVAAVSASGLAADRFAFLGFLPRKGPPRARLLEQFRPLPVALVLYESPHRIAETCADLAAVWGDRRAVIARELTKLHEELLRGTLSELADRLGQGEVRGEIVLVVEGAEELAQEEPLTPEALEAEVRRQLALGDRPIKEVARQLSESLGVPRRELYALALRLSGKREP
jgi:16S rRNA (cytidine1402-2'-O)-methyltransferase